MIHVEREQWDGTTKIEPASSWKTSANTRTTHAIEHHADDDFEFASTYKTASVKRALEKLFHGKCAYCEWKPAAGSSWDVEHFRPKGRVAERPDHPGYYWLAYRWTNLYFSCQLCNQRQTDARTWDDRPDAEEPVAGKLDQFPVADEALRKMADDDDDHDIADEGRLLIDPCADDPAVHIAFGVDGGVIDLDEMGEASIRVYNLNRRRLKRLRAERLEAVRSLLIIEGKLRDELGEPSLADALRAHLDRYFFADDAEFAGLCRAVRDDPDAFGLGPPP
ncbi:MAG: hypothetical protein ABIO70_32080 [Pseudomonadota bacterium]